MIGYHPPQLPVSLRRQRRHHSLVTSLDWKPGAVQYWNESLAIDEDRAIRERQSELWDLELQAYLGDLEGALDRTLLGGSLTDLAATPAAMGWIRARS